MFRVPRSTHNTVTSNGNRQRGFAGNNSEFDTDFIHFLNLEHVQQENWMCGQCAGVHRVEVFNSTWSHGHLEYPSGFEVHDTGSINHCLSDLEEIQC